MSMLIRAHTHTSRHARTIDANAPCTRHNMHAYAACLHLHPHRRSRTSARKRMELEVIDQKVLVFVVKRMWAQLQPQGVVHATCVNLGACNEPSTNVPNRQSWCTAHASVDRLTHSPCLTGVLCNAPTGPETRVRGTWQRPQARGSLSTNARTFMRTARSPRRTRATSSNTHQISNLYLSLHP
jgi:hypothetical protein